MPKLRKDLVITGAIIAVAVVVVFISLAAAIPAISDLQRAGDVAADRERFMAISGSTAEGYAEAAKQAEAYNARIAGYEAKFTIWPYEKQLEYVPGGEMAWLDVPSVGISIPIYKGASRSGDLGAGHLADTALPVGGTSTRCIVGGYDKPGGGNAFDDLVRLQRDATFTVWSLGKAHTYQAREIREVFAAEAWKEPAPAGKDLFTLVAAAPPADGKTASEATGKVLMVTGERMDSDAESESATFASMINERSFTIFLAIFASVVAVVACVILVRRRVAPKEDLTELAARLGLDTTVQQPAQPVAVMPQQVIQQQQQPVIQPQQSYQTSPLRTQNNNYPPQ